MTTCIVTDTISDILLAGNRCTGWERRADEFKIPIWGTNQTTVLRGEWAELHQILEVHRTIIDAPQVRLDFRIRKTTLIFAPQLTHTAAIAELLVT